MKKNYEEILLEILFFQQEDVIATSGETFATGGMYGEDDEWLTIG